MNFKRILMRIFFLLALLGLASITSPTSRAERPPAVSIIVDTDFETDVDDVAALALLHSYADTGQAEILGVTVSGLHALSGKAIDAVNTYYGRPDLPIGVRTGNGVLRQSHYTQMLIDEFPSDLQPATAPSAVTLLRRLLAAQSDRSTVIVTLGYSTNMAELLRTMPDGISSLPGDRLVAQKVSRLVCMGGDYPSQTKTGGWGNFLPDPESIRHVNEHWPTPIVFTGGGAFSRSVPTGGAFVPSV